MRHVYQIAIQPFQDRAAVHLSAESFAGWQWNVLEILRQLSDLCNFGRRTEQEIFILPIELGQRTDDVPGVGSHAKFVDPANVDGDLHRKI